jgi:WD40 repeat protein
MCDTLTGHPSVDRLRAFSGGGLDDAEHAALVDHVADCPVCWEHLEGLGDADPFLDRLRQALAKPAPPDLDGVTGDWRPQSEPGGEVPVVPGYELLGEIGRGGMGVVYKARQVILNRTVALKVLPGAGLSDPGRLLRFRMEGEIAARVQHPNVVRTFEAGVVNGRPYLVLEYVNGGTLRDRLGGQPLPPREAAVLTETLARAVQAAHSQGVLHRDLKPANVLLDHDGVARVGDFGIALDLHAAARLTETGLIAGTPEYMAPEQITETAEGVGPAADVYALGVILYECLIGQPPFRGARTLDFLQRVCEEEPTPPRRLRPSVPADLETVCLKALRKRPSERYASAAALADDLHRFLEGEPITARRVGGLERAWKWCRRRRAVAALLAVAVFSLIAGAGASAYFGFQDLGRARQAESEKRQANQARQETALALHVASQAQAAAEQERTQSAKAAAQLLLDHGVARAREGEVAEGLHWMLAALETSPDPEFRLRARTHLAAWAARQPSLWHWLDTRNDSVAISPDGQRLVSAGTPPQGSEVLLRFWDLRTGNRLGDPLRTRDKGLIGPSFSPDCRTLLTVSGSILDYQSRKGWAKRWDVASRALLGTSDHDAVVDLAAWSPDGRFYATASSDRTVHVWDTHGERVGKPIPLGRTDAFKGRSAQSLAFSPDGRWLLVGSDRLAQVFDAVTGLPADEPLTEDVGAAGPPLNGVAFDPAGRFVLATGGLFRQDCYAVLRGWDPARGRMVGRPVRVANPSGPATFLDDGRACSFAGTRVSADGTLFLRPGDGTQIWRSARDRSRPAEDLPVAAWPGEKPLGLREVLFTPDGRHVWAAGGSARMAQCWETSTGRPVGHPAEAGAAWLYSDFTLSPDGRLLATRLFTPQNHIQVWDTTTGLPVGKSLGHPNLALVMAFSPDSRLLATGGHFHDVHVWDLASGQLVWDPRKLSDMILHLAFSPDGRSLAVTCHDGLVNVLDVPTGRPLLRPLQHPDFAVRVVFSPDGRRLLTQDLSAGHLWELPGGQRIGAPMSYPPTTFPRRHDVQGRFSPDGKVLLLSSGYGSFRLWDGVTAQPFGPQTPVGKAQTSCFAFRADGRLVVSGHEDGTTQVWEVEGTRPVGSPFHQAGAVVGVAFCPDGRGVWTFGSAGSLRTWPLPTPLDGDPERIKRVLELMTGLARDASGDVTPLNRTEWEKRRRAWLEREGPTDWRLSLSSVADLPASPKGIADLPVSPKGVADLPAPPKGVADLPASPKGVADLPAATWHDARASDAEDVGAVLTARWHLDRLIALRPNDWLLHARRARTYTDEEDWGPAEADQEQALRSGGAGVLLEWCRCRAGVCRSRDQAAAALWYEERVRRLEEAERKKKQ